MTTIRWELYRHPETAQGAHLRYQRLGSWLVRFSLGRLADTVG